MFARNGSVGAEAYIHPGFIKHLRYMLFGAKLPDEVMKAFEDEAGDPDMVSFGDALDLGKFARAQVRRRSEEHTSELQSLMRTSYAVFCLKKKTKPKQYTS